MRANLDALFEVSAALISAVELTDPAVATCVIELLSSIARFDHVVIFAYLGEKAPIHLYSTFDAAEYDVFVTQYVAGPYLLDPFYRNTLEGGEGVWRMRELAPDRFFSSEYYRSYYSKTALAEEIGFFVPLDKEAKVVISVMRKQATGMFSPVEFSQVRKVAPVISAVATRFWSNIAARFEPDPAVHSDKAKIDQVWSRVQSTFKLTVREAAIIDLVLQGHSSESIGLRLNISTGTVKVHRRNIYRKLGISSQMQLFSMFFST